MAWEVVEANERKPVRWRRPLAGFPKWILVACGAVVGVAGCESRRRRRRWVPGLFVGAATACGQVEPSLGEEVVAVAAAVAAAEP